MTTKNKTTTNEDAEFGDLDQIPLEIRKDWHQMLLPHKEVLEDLGVSHVEKTLTTDRQAIHVVIDKKSILIVFKLIEMSPTGPPVIKLLMTRLPKNNWESVLLKESNASNTLNTSNGDKLFIFEDKLHIDRAISKLDPGKEMGTIDALLDVRNLIFKNHDSTLERISDGIPPPLAPNDTYHE